MINETSEALKMNMQVYVLNKAGFMGTYAFMFNYNPFLNQKPALIAVLCPILSQKEFGTILFNISGHILSVNDSSSSKFGITPDFVYKLNRTDLVIFDIFKGLKDCLNMVESDKAEEVFYYIDLDTEVVENYTKYRQIKKQLSGQASVNESSEGLNDHKDSKSNHRKRVEVMVRILPADPRYKDMFLLNFNFSDNQSEYEQEQTMSINDMDITQNFSLQSRFRSTKILSALEELEILPDNMENDQKDDDNETRNLLNSTMKSNNLDILKNMIAEKKTSKTFRMYYIGIALLFLASFLVYLAGVFHQNYYLNKSLKLQYYQITLKNMYVAVWHIMFYVRKLDAANIKGSPSHEYIRFLKDMLNTNMIIAKNELYMILEAHQLYIIEENPDLNYINMHMLIETTEYVVSKPVGDNYLHFIESVNNIIKSDSINLSSTYLLTDLSFIIKNGLNSLSVR